MVLTEFTAAYAAEKWHSFAVLLGCPCGIYIKKRFKKKVTDAYVECLLYLRDVTNKQILDYVVTLHY